jgi:hypothetical protein
VRDSGTAVILAAAAAGNELPGEVRPTTSVVFEAHAAGRKNPKRRV